MRSAAFFLALRITLGALFAYAGATKLLDPAAFSEEIANYRLLPTLAPLLANTLPMIELLTGLVLALGSGAWRTGAALLALALLAVFTLAVTSAWLRGVDVRCGCFGTGGGPVDGLTVLRDLGFVLAAALTLRHSWPRAGTGAD